MLDIHSKDEFIKKDDQFLWHGMRRYNPDAPPMIVTEGKGAWIKDTEGHEYLDGMSGLWSVNVGYGREEIAAAAYEQLKTMPFYPLSNSHIPAIELGEVLNEWLDGEYVFFFSNSGSEANETAFKIARQYHDQNGEHGRYKFISRYRAYHGGTAAALAATGQAQRKYRYEPLSSGFLHVSPPDPYRSPYKGTVEEMGQAYADEIERVITWELEQTIAGVIMEPIITGGGIIVPPENYLPKVQEICNRHGVLLIIDEVICGFGRTGAKFGFMNYGIKPDIVTMAKGVTSSYLPLAVTAVRKDIYEAFKGSDEYAHFRHINTFGGHPASCAVALKNLEIMKNENLIARSAELGSRLLQEVQDLTSHPNVGSIRGKGLLLGIELVKDQSTKDPIELDVINRVIGGCKSRGLIIGKNGDTVAGFNNVLTIAPPLCLTEEDFTFLVKNLKEAMAEI